MQNYKLSKLKAGPIIIVSRESLHYTDIEILYSPSSPQYS